jgi:hypothetical protein
MLQSVEGIFRNGKVELLEPAPISKETRVVVTFLPDTKELDLGAKGIDETRAADLRQRLKTFQEDWDRPDMDVYDEV